MIQILKNVQLSFIKDYLAIDTNIDTRGFIKMIAINMNMFQIKFFKIINGNYLFDHSLL